MIPQEFVLSFKKGISLLEQLEGEQIILQSLDRKLTFKQVTPGLHTALKTLSTNGGTARQLTNLVQRFDNNNDLPKFYYYLQKFFDLGWLCYSVFLNQLPIATAVPLTPDYQFIIRDVGAQHKYVLSRFAYIHQIDGQLLLESPLSQVQVLLTEWRGAAFITQLAKPQDYYSLTSQIPGITEEVAKQLVSLLLSTQMISEIQANRINEQENAVLKQWNFHDLLFHSRSRKGRHTNPYGGTHRFLGKIDPLPSVKSRMSTVSVELYKPDLEIFKKVDAPFSYVLEQRKSLRKYGEKPLTVQQLGEFLYRSSRVKDIIKTEYGELSRRPYPSGGAIYELELYIVVNNCECVSSGLYHYEPVSHQLCKLSDRTNYVENLLKDASQAMGFMPECMLQVVIVITARFQRQAWKYESIAYALMLKNVGVLYQTMYLVATAMDLAPCALGGGDSDLFAKAAGIDYYAETSIGEFALGSKCS
jgi:SagB-type dehydrogenase family enzyme